MYRISCVKYTNSMPFIYGLRTSDLSNMVLSLDTPADCYDKLVSDQVDIGLVPVVALRKNPGYEIISAYCIGAREKVNSVLLVSSTGLKDIRKIYLDYQSRTSVELVKILCRESWNIEPEFIPADPGFVREDIPANSAYVVIGDRAFAFLDHRYQVYDLAGEWYAFTGKPFVFACWIANKEIDRDFRESFNQALKNGIEARSSIINDFGKNFPEKNIGLEEYFFRNIHYNFDSDSKEGMELFLNLLQ